MTKLPSSGLDKQMTVFETDTFIQLNQELAKGHKSVNPSSEKTEINPFLCWFNGGRSIRTADSLPDKR